MYREFNSRVKGIKDTQGLSTPEICELVERVWDENPCGFKELKSYGTLTNLLVGMVRLLSETAKPSKVARGNIYD